MTRIHDLKYSDLYTKFWIVRDNQPANFCDVFRNVELFLET